MEIPSRGFSTVKNGTQLSNLRDISSQVRVVHERSGRAARAERSGGGSPHRVASPAHAHGAVVAPRTHLRAGTTEYTAATSVNIHYNVIH